MTNPPHTGATTCGTHVPDASAPQAIPAPASLGQVTR
jgi:hypothetical protein